MAVCFENTIYHFLHVTQMIVPGAPYWNFDIGQESGEVEKDEQITQFRRRLMCCAQCQQHGGKIW
jgi:hypothetical protein